MRIAVKAAGINFADTLARIGLYPDAPKLPCVVGYEVAGEIESVGEGVDSHKVGDRVIAGTRFNGQAELVTVPAEQAFPLPKKLSFEEGAAFPVNYATAYAALVIMGGLKEGERVLIHAAAGGVGIAATQIARGIGAEIFGTASASKHDAIREQGVDARDRLPDAGLRAGGAEDHRRRGPGRDHGRPRPDLVPQGLPAAAPRRAADHVRALRGAERQRQARHPGRPAEPRPDAAGDDAVVEEPRGDEREQGRLRPQHARTGGIARATSTGPLEPLLEGLEKGELKPVVAEAFPFDRAPDAHRLIEERRNIGKVVLVP